VYKGIIPLILEHSIEELEEKSHGTTMKHITKQTLLPHKVLLPPLPEQKRIVNLISSVDSYIQALQRQLESAKRSRNAVLYELLTSGGNDWVETTLGQISRCAGGCAFPDAFQGNKEVIAVAPVVGTGNEASVILRAVGAVGNAFVNDNVLAALKQPFVFTECAIILPIVPAP
jgi:hypothetical protein